MPDHWRSRRALFFRQRQEFDGKLAHYVAVERDNVRGPGAIESGKQQGGSSGGLSERLRLFNQRRARSSAALVSGYCVATDMQERRSLAPPEA